MDVDVKSRVDSLIRQILTPLTPETLYSQQASLPLFAEAAPDEFLRILEDDLHSSEPQIFTLLKVVGSGVTASCPRAGLLWALECLAWRPEWLSRVSTVLAQLATRELDDNWANTPTESLLSIFRCWIPQTAGDLQYRTATLQLLARNYPVPAWQICRDQFSPGMRTGNYNYRPRWRNDASGAGGAVNNSERHGFAVIALELALAWPNHDAETLGDMLERFQGMPPEHQAKLWNVIEDWATRQDDDRAKAQLRERLRTTEFAPREGAQAIDEATAARIRHADELLVASDVVMRHHWLFAEEWLRESPLERSDEAWDWEEHRRVLRDQRAKALAEIWQDRGWEGVDSLVAGGGDAWLIGRTLAGTGIDGNEIASMIAKWLGLNGSPLNVRRDLFLAGLLHEIPSETRLNTVDALLPDLGNDDAIRFLKLCPFDRDTWRLVEGHGTEFEEKYWKGVQPPFGLDDDDINEAVDHLLSHNRPRAAFRCTHRSLDPLETSRLTKMLQDIVGKTDESEGTYPLEAHQVAEAFDSLQGRPGIGEDEMARLEYKYVRVLYQTTYGVPNLQRHIAKTPALFAQLIAIMYERTGGGDDPPEWTVVESDDRAAAAGTARIVLGELKRIPGTTRTGQVDRVQLRMWITDVRTLCHEGDRTAAGDQHIGTLLSYSPMGKDGVWPCESVRDVFEEVRSPDIAMGMKTGRYNAGGVRVWRQEAKEEQGLSERYRSWAGQLSSHPFLARTLEELAAWYERDVSREELDSRLRRRFLDR